MPNLVVRVNDDDTIALRVQPGITKSTDIDVIPHDGHSVKVILPLEKYSNNDKFSVAKTKDSVTIGITNGTKTINYIIPADKFGEVQIKSRDMDGAPVRLNAEKLTPENFDAGVKFKRHELGISAVVNAVSPLALNVSDNKFRQV